MSAQTKKKSVVPSVPNKLSLAANVQQFQASGAITLLDPRDVLTKDELAERLKTSPRVVYGMTRTRTHNRIPFFKVGRELRFSWRAVSEWAEQQQRQVA